MAYSTDTDTHYGSWDELVGAEANGWCLVIQVTNSKGRTWPYVLGPFDSRRDANNARQRVNYSWRRDLGSEGYSAKFFVRPLWPS